MSVDHSYVAYASDLELRTAAAGYLSDGMRQGQQVGYFGWGSNDELRDRTSGLAGMDEFIQAGSARLTSLDEHFRRDEAPDAATLVTFWSDATDAALLAGFTALRVVTDTTPWARLPVQRTRFLRAEHWVERHHLERPFAQLCAGDASILDQEALAEVACVHPSAVGVSPSFHLHAMIGTDFALDGEVDASTFHLLERVVSTMGDVGARRELLIDAGALAFIEHRGLLTLEGHAERSGLSAVVLRDAPAAVGELVELLELRRVRT